MLYKQTETIPTSGPETEHRAHLCTARAKTLSRQSIGFLGHALGVLIGKMLPVLYRFRPSITCPRPRLNFSHHP